MTKLGLVLLAAVGLAGCAVEDFVTDNNSSVLFKIASINGGAALKVDVASDKGGVINNLAPVTIAVRPKNQNFDNVPQVPMAVFVERYEIRYYRSDGRATEGVDVPYKISGNMTTAVDVGTGSGANVTVSMEFVRVQAKMEPPLSTLSGVGQGIVITMFAELTLHGRTTAGEAVMATGTLQLNCSDFVDEG
jgi:hypothetical protein